MHGQEKGAQPKPRVLQHLQIDQRKSQGMRRSLAFCERKTPSVCVRKAQEESVRGREKSTESIAFENLRSMRMKT